MRKFTKQQVDFICYQIGEWYVQWKNQLVDYETRTHRLGFAKEDLKRIICGEEYEDLEDEYDVNPKTNPWETEPDFFEFVDESTGYRCFIQRHSERKHLCGYVELPKEHKLYGKDYINNEEIFNKLDVHGGVTYTGEIRFKQQNYTIEYVVGFDCGHWTDYVPFSWPWGMNKIIANETYKDIEYVTNECKNLAKQLRNHPLTFNKSSDNYPIKSYTIFEWKELSRQFWNIVNLLLLIGLSPIYGNWLILVG